MTDRTSGESWIDPETERAARIFLQRLTGRYDVRASVLFGSRARRDHTATSDADVAIVLGEAHFDRRTIVLDFAGLTFDVLLETGILVDALPLTEADFERPDDFPNPKLIFNLRHEGLRL